VGLGWIGERISGAFSKEKDDAFLSSFIWNLRDIPNHSLAVIFGLDICPRIPIEYLKKLLMNVNVGEK
jgi:hypothetical protein